MRPIFHGIYYSIFTVNFQYYFVYSIFTEDKHIVYGTLFKFFFLLCPSAGYIFPCFLSELFSAILDKEKASDTAMEKKVDISVPHGIQQTIKMDILGMIHSAANPFDIIYHVAKYLEDTSAEAGYAQNILENMRAVYGLALLDKKLLQDELDEVTARGERIAHAYKTGDFSEEEKKRIEFAMILHRKNADRLRELIKKAEIDGTPPYLERK